MPYSYQIERATVVTPENFPKIMRAKDAVAKVAATAGAITFNKAMSLTGFHSSWEMMACLDYLVELGYFTKTQGLSDDGQDQILIPK